MKIVEISFVKPKRAAAAALLLAVGVGYGAYEKGKADQDENAPTPLPSVAVAAAQHNAAIDSANLRCSGFTATTQAGGKLAVHATLNNSGVEGGYLTTTIDYAGGRKPGVIDGLDGTVALPPHLDSFASIDVVAHAPVGQHTVSADCGAQRLQP